MRCLKVRCIEKLYIYIYIYIYIIYLFIFQLNIAFSNLISAFLIQIFMVIFYKYMFSHIHIWVTQLFYENIKTCPLNA
jgi:hypothetical protein